MPHLAVNKENRSMSEFLNLSAWNHPFTFCAEIKKSCHCLTYLKVVGVQKFAQRTSSCITTEQPLCSLPASAEAGGALALPRHVIAQSAIATVTVLAAVNAVLAERARLGTDGTLWKKRARDEPNATHQSRTHPRRHSHDRGLSYWCVDHMDLRFYLFPTCAMPLSI